MTSLGNENTPLSCEEERMVVYGFSSVVKIKVAIRNQSRKTSFIIPRSQNLMLKICESIIWQNLNNIIVLIYIYVI